MDHADDEDHEQPEEAVVDDVATDVEGFSGGPHDTLVLQDYVYHVAAKNVDKFSRPAPEIEGLLAVTGLIPLIACSLDIGDRELMSAFVERWHTKISSFHLLVGEVTITLDDAASLLHLPITGTFHSFEPLHVDHVVLLLVELLEVSVEEARAKTVQCHGAYV
ncbi:Protein MAIN-LIKE 2 [Glycine soja]